MLQEIRKIKADDQKNLTLVRIPSRKPEEQEIRVQYFVLAPTTTTDTTRSRLSESEGLPLCKGPIDTSLYLAGATGLDLSAKSTYKRA